MPTEVLKFRESQSLAPGERFSALGTDSLLMHTTFPERSHLCHCLQREAIRAKANGGRLSGVEIVTSVGVRNHNNW